MLLHRICFAVARELLVTGLLVPSVRERVGRPAAARKRIAVRPIIVVKEEQVWTLLSPDGSIVATCNLCWWRGGQAAILVMTGGWHAGTTLAPVRYPYIFVYALF